MSEKLLAGGGSYRDYGYAGKNLRSAFERDFTLDEPLQSEKTNGPGVRNSGREDVSWDNVSPSCWRGPFPSRPRPPIVETKIMSPVWQAKAAARKHGIRGGGQGSGALSGIDRHDDLMEPLKPRLPAPKLSSPVPAKALLPSKSRFYPAATPKSSSATSLYCQSRTQKCSQYCVQGHQFCIRHILEDLHAPYKQCDYTEMISRDRCLFPVSLISDDIRFAFSLSLLIHHI